MWTNNSSEHKQNGRWTREEHEKFVYGLKLHGKDWKKIEEIIQTRNSSQIRSHAQKFFIKIKKQTNEEEPKQINELQSNSKQLQETLVNQSQSKLVCQNFKQMSFYISRITQLVQKSQISIMELDFWSLCIEGSQVESIRKEQNEYPSIIQKQYNFGISDESTQIFKRNAESCFQEFGKQTYKKVKLQ